VNDDMAWLAEWYVGNCNGDWEHEFGVTIGTLDNPGWSLKIDLSRTKMEEVPFADIHVDVEPDEPEQGGSGLTSWWICKVVDKQFVAYCGPRDLITAVAIFRDWVEHAHGGSRRAN
jgi:hypothetical protein